MTLLYPPEKNGITKTLDAQLDAGVTDAVTLNNCTNIQNKPGAFVVNRVDASSVLKSAALREYVTYTAVSGNTLTGLTRNADGSSTDQDHAVGSVVEFISDVLQQQAILDAVSEEHNQDGTHDTDKVVDLTTAQVLTNKTLTSPVINTGLSGTAKASGAEVTTGTEDAKFVTPKAISDAGVNTRLKSKTIFGTRNLAADGGDVAYTGVGFVPTSIVCMAHIGDICISNGGADSAKVGKCIFSAQSAAYVQSGQSDHLSFLTVVLHNWQACVVKSYDADGFTLTWGKNGVPTGTANLVFLCFR